MQVLLEESFGFIPQGFCFSRNSGRLFLHRVVAAPASREIVSAATAASCDLQDVRPTYTGHLVEMPSSTLIVHELHRPLNPLHSEPREKLTAPLRLLSNLMKERGSKDVCKKMVFVYICAVVGWVHDHSSGRPEHSVRGYHGRHF